MQKNLRVQVIQDLYAEVRKSRTGDLSRAVDFLKKLEKYIRVNRAKENKLEKNYVKSRLDKADLPFFGGKVVQETYLMALKHGNKIIIKF